MQYANNYPLTVRQSGFNIICTKDVTINVESKPFAPCTKTGLPSWSRHCATTQAAFKEFKTKLNQLLLSKRDIHLSGEHVTSLQAIREQLI